MLELYSVTYYYPDGGFGMEYYELPYDKHQLSLDVLKHLKDVINLLREGPALHGYPPSEMLQKSIHAKEIAPVSLEKLKNKYIRKERLK